MASGIDMKAGSVLTWTSISSRASSAIHSSVAATAAIGSPTYRTFSRASASSSWLTGRMPNFTGRSSPVMTASTPGSARARLVSTLRIRACGCGLRRIRPYTIRGGARSSANFVCPLTLAKASGLVSDLPMMDRSSATSRTSRRGQLDRLEDLDVAGATAENARQRVFDGLARRVGVAVEQRHGGKQHRRRAIPALRGAELGEGDLKGMRIAAPCHAFDRHDVAALQVEGHRQAGEVRFAIDQHTAGRALAQLAAMFGAGESQVFAKNFEQRLVWQHHDRHVLAVDPQADGNLVRDRHAPTLEGLDR